MMIGGAADGDQASRSIFRSLAPGKNNTPCTPGQDGDQHAPHHTEDTIV
jgi:hypothetical protein